MRAVLVAVLLALVGCGGAARPVALSGAWPTQPRDFDDVTEDWTRHDELHGGYQEIIDVYATLKSPEWLLAHATREARLRGLDAAQTQKLVEEYKAQHAKEYEVALIVSTWDRMQNNLHRKDPVWQVTLIDDKGTAIAPTKIRRDKRPRNMLRGDFPEVGDFAEAYVATFARPPDVLGPGVKQVRLRVSSVKGFVEVAWLDGQ